MVITNDRIDTTAPGELLARARAGDAPAFCQLIQPFQPRLLRQAVALAGEVGAAEDLVSETLVQAWKSLARYDETCRFSTWLYAILLHRRQKWARRARSRPLALAWLPSFRRDDLTARQVSLPSPEPSPSEYAAQNEFSARLRQCVDQLPERHRRVILLRFFQDASLPDMARVLGCSVGTVKSRLHHALEKLRKMKMNLPELKGDTQI
ncbi:MAG TPA: sigma-70 family RNA polymerase sigma factor [Candidatus Acidoferrum sp.]|nr:sigma-70 family RNA polymerase sigma factor [Candidatus Acidoferrum sp.]